METPNVINVTKKLKGHAPIVKVNNPTDSIRVIIEESRNPIYLQIDVADDYIKDRQGELVKTLSGCAVQWFTDNRNIPSIIRSGSMVLEKLERQTWTA